MSITPMEGDSTGKCDNGEERQCVNATAKLGDDSKVTNTKNSSSMNSSAVTLNTAKSESQSEHSLGVDRSTHNEDETITSLPEGSINPEHIATLRDMETTIKEQLAKIYQSIYEAKIKKKRAEAAREELDSIKPEAKVYQQQARIFVERTPAELGDIIDKDEANADAELPRLQKVEKDLKERLVKTETERCHLERLLLEALRSLGTKAGASLEVK